MRMGTCRSYDVVIGSAMRVFQSSLNVSSLEGFHGYAKFWGSGVRWEEGFALAFMIGKGDMFPFS